MKTRRDTSFFYLLTLVLVTLLVFIGALVLRTKSLYISPDETANAFFTQRYAEEGLLTLFDPLNVAFFDRIHPRSIVSLNGHLVPGSFIGLPVLYGSLAMLLGDWILPIATPLLALLAVFAWYGISRKIFPERIAFLSALLLSFHPGWWYYSTRGFMHNVLFVSLLLFAAYFFLVRPVAEHVKSQSRWLWLKDLDVVLSGVLLGFALMVRASEVVWVGGALVLGLVWMRSLISWKTIAILACSVLLGLMPLFFLNRATYGGPLHTGYTAQSALVEQDMERVLVSEDDAGTAIELDLSTVPFLPFGIDVRASAKHVLQYGLGLFWWMGILALIGIPLVLPPRGTRKRERAPRKLYFAIAVLVSAWLSFMYGSWTIFDNPDITKITIANSYVRYWIPIYLLMTPFAAYAIEWLTNRARTEAAKNIFAAAIILLCFGLSVRAVFFQPEDGIAAVAATLDRSTEIKAAVLAQTEPESVIVVDRADKLFFPDRRVLYPLRDESTYELMPRLERRVPLYYYGVTFPERDMEYLNTVKLKELGLQIELLETFDKESLYHIFAP